MSQLRSPKVLAVLIALLLTVSQAQAEYGRLEPGKWALTAQGVVVKVMAVDGNRITYSTDGSGSPSSTATVDRSQITPETYQSRGIRAGMSAMDEAGRTGRVLRIFGDKIQFGLQGSDQITEIRASVDMTAATAQSYQLKVGDQVLDSKGRHATVVGTYGERVELDTDGDHKQRNTQYSSSVSRQTSEWRGVREGDFIRTHDGRAGKVNAVFGNRATMIDGKYAQNESVIEGHNIASRATGNPVSPWQQVTSRMRTSGLRALPILDVVGNVSRIAGATRDAQIAADLAAGKCPADVSSEAVFNEALKADMAKLNLASEDCKKQGRPFAFQSFVEKIKQGDAASFTQVTCTDRGEVRIVHKNGTSSTVKFSGENELASITSHSPNDPDQLRFEYRMSDASGRQPWSIVSTMRMNGATPKMSESFLSFTNRYRCSLNPCTSNEFAGAIDRVDDATTIQNPFGLYAGSRTKAVATSQFTTKKLLTATFMSERSFEKTCQKLGAKAPARDATLFTVLEGLETAPAATAVAGDQRVLVPAPTATRSAPAQQ